MRGLSLGHALRARAASRARLGDERGFTLIELVIVVSILPIVIGGIAVGLVSIFSISGSASNRLSDSGDAQVVSAYFAKDVEGATQLTTDPNVTQCGTGTQLLGLESGYSSQPPVGYQTVISYVTAPNGSTTSQLLVRQVCSAGASATPTSSSVVSRGIVLGQLPPVVTQTSTNNPALGWISTRGVTDVAFVLAESASNFQYTLEAVPRASANASQPSAVAPHSTSCGFAAPNTGTYASTLCFVDFSNWNTQTGTACAGGGIEMSAGVAKSPFTMTFCVSVAGVQCPANGGATISGYHTDSSDGHTYVDYNDIHAVAIPTWQDGQNGQSFLGNIDPATTPPTPFYTGIPGNPALYTGLECSTAVVTITSIAVTDSAGNPATGWSLVTGDAESTDNTEAITWTSDQNLNLLPNGIDPALPFGNACNSGTSTPNLTGTGTKTVQCMQTVSTNTKTGTVMLSASTPTSLTVTLQGAGLQAMFMGLLLPS